MGLRRQYVISADSDPMERSWWESCTLGGAERDRFTIASKTSPHGCGTVSYWDIEPMASQWGSPAKGLYDLAISPDLRRSGVATFLVGESLRRSDAKRGRVGRSAGSPIGRSIDRPYSSKLGFEQVSRGYANDKAFGLTILQILLPSYRVISSWSSFVVRRLHLSSFLRSSF